MPQTRCGKANYHKKIMERHIKTQKKINVLCSDKETIFMSDLGAILKHPHSCKNVNKEQ